MRSRRPRKIVLIASCLALIVTACGGDDGADDEAEGRKGGTLKLVGEGDIDHMDTAAAYYTVTYMLQRGFTRQLVSYPADEDFEKANEIVADVVTEVPTVENGGISEDGMTYTFTLREGVQWDTDPPRQVTAQDFIRGLKRLCNPVAGTGAPGYYTGTIVGMKEYCDGFVNVEGTAAAIKEYITSNEVSGLTAVDDLTLEVQLLTPASDFLNIMAMPFASAAPEEYLEYEPDGAELRQNTISNGPYRITEYEANKRIVLERNPAWNADTDPLREAYVDRIEVQEGTTGEAVQQQLEAGTADMSWDTPVPTARIPALRDDERLGIYPAGSTNPYLSINLRSPNENGAMANLQVRQALNYAVNKVAIGQIYGGPEINEPLDQVLTSPITGYEKFNLYETPNHEGDPDRARDLLAQAGYPDGLNLKMVTRTQGNHLKVAQSIQNDLAKAGIEVELIQVRPQDFYSEYLRKVDVSERGVWDIAAPGWVPDWNGNGARTFFDPLFASWSAVEGGTNYGGYKSEAVDALIEQALSTPNVDEAAELWAQADRQVMEDAAFVPLQNQKSVVFHSSRVQNFIYSPFSQNGDITMVWLEG